MPFQIDFWLRFPSYVKRKIFFYFCLSFETRQDEHWNDILIVIDSYSIGEVLTSNEPLDRHEKQLLMKCHSFQGDLEKNPLRKEFLCDWVDMFFQTLDQCECLRWSRINTNDQAAIFFSFESVCLFHFQKDLFVLTSNLMSTFFRYLRWEKTRLFLFQRCSSCFSLRTSKISTIVNEPKRIFFN